MAPRNFILSFMIGLRMVIELIDPKLVGFAIKKCREDKELTQDVLSGLAGLDRTHYSKIERGLRSPNIDSLFKIAAALDIMPHELMKEIEKYVFTEE